MIEDIDAAIISRVLDVDQATVTRHKYNVRKEIEQLYPDGEFDCKVINLLYDRINSRHYKIFCVNGNTGFRNESRIFYFIHLQNEEAYERKESSSA